MLQSAQSTVSLKGFILAKSVSKAVRLRRICREGLAIAFWLHALYATHLFDLPPRFVLHAPAYMPTLLLAIAIAFYSLLAEYEWISVLADCFYIYLWPCIIGVKLAWLGIKSVYRYVRPRLIVQPTALIVAPQPAPVPKVTAVAPEKEQVAEQKARLALTWIVRPLTQFSLLWALMILTAKSTAIVVLATAVALGGAGRAIYKLWDFTSDASSWIEKIKGTFASQIANHVAQVRVWEQTSQIQEVIKIANALKMLEAIFVFISQNRKFLARATTVVATFLTVVFYFYISFLFSCAFAGMAKVQGITWPWWEAFTTSLFIPYAYTNLPHNFVLQLFGGLEAVAITLLGWNIGTIWLKTRMKRIALAAAELRGPFEDQTLRAKLILIEEQTANPAQAAAPAAAELSVLHTVAADSPDTEATTKSVPRKGFRQGPKTRRKKK